MSTIGKSLIRGAKEALQYARDYKSESKIHKIKTNKTQQKNEKKNKIAYTEIHAP